MKCQTVVLHCFVAFAIAGCSSSSPSSSEPDTLVKGGYDEAEMAAATQRAVDEVETFISMLSGQHGDNFAVKAPVIDGEITEHFWLTDVYYANGKFKGIIGNDPGLVSNVSIGQKWELRKEEISDWMYMLDGKMYGNYTLRPLLATMPEAEADELRAILAEP